MKLSCTIILDLLREDYSEIEDVIKGIITQDNLSLIKEVIVITKLPASSQKFDLLKSKVNFIPLEGLSLLRRSSALEGAINLAKGEIILFTSSQELLESDCISKHLMAHDSKNVPIFVWGKHKLNKDQSQQTIHRALMLGENYSLHNSFHLKNRIFKPQKLINFSINKELIKRYKLSFDQNLSNSAFIDYKFFHSLYENALSYLTIEDTKNTIFLFKTFNDILQEMEESFNDLCILVNNQTKLLSDVLDEFDVKSYKKEEEYYRQSKILPSLYDLINHLKNLDQSIESNQRLFNVSEEKLLSSTSDAITLLLLLTRKMVLFGPKPKLLFTRSLTSKKKVANSNKLKILFQIRKDAYEKPGGDTVLLKNLLRELEALNQEVTYDPNHTSNPRDFDIVHFINMTIPEALQKPAEKTINCDTPYVITSLYEDRKDFFLKMAAYSESLINEVITGKAIEPELIIKNYSNKGLDDNPYAHFLAMHASSILVTGQYEIKIIKKDYPFNSRFDICHFGSSLGMAGDNGKLFYKEFGIKDFIFCVGRIEAKKNQLMLLKAFEDSPIPIVFATGGFVAQEVYEKACRNFKRKGKTIFLGRVSAELLASAYSGSRVHALPSWCELPGLVSLEAAKYGTNVVSPKNGTLEDYLSDLPFYCEPDNIKNIHQTVSMAYESPKSELLEKKANEYTWEKSAREHLSVYQSVLGI